MLTFILRGKQVEPVGFILIYFLTRHHWPNRRSAPFLVNLEKSWHFGGTYLGETFSRYSSQTPQVTGIPAAHCKHLRYKAVTPSPFPHITAPNTTAWEHSEQLVAAWGIVPWHIAEHSAVAVTHLMTKRSPSSAKWCSVSCSTAQHWFLLSPGQGLPTSKWEWNFSYKKDVRFFWLWTPNCVGWGNPPCPGHSEAWSHAWRRTAPWQVTAQTRGWCVCFLDCFVSKTFWKVFIRTKPNAKTSEFFTKQNPCFLASPIIEP